VGAGSRLAKPSRSDARRIVVAVAQARSGRITSSKLTAVLAHGELAEDGVLFIEYTSGKTDVIIVPKPGKARTSAAQKPGKKTQRDPEFKPVNAIFVRNQSRAAVTVSRWHYISELGGVGFRFESQPAASPRGDHLPKRLEPGEDAILLHDFVPMRAFLNQVLRDHGADAALFEVVLTLTEHYDVPRLRRSGASR
jgi:hypothetical protein